jgi:RND superfamily putative drug exporter
LLLPVFLRLSGRAAWWLPRPLAHALPTVRFGHGETDAA